MQVLVCRSLSQDSHRAPPLLLASRPAQRMCALLSSPVSLRDRGGRTLQMAISATFGKSLTTTGPSTSHAEEAHDRGRGGRLSPRVPVHVTVRFQRGHPSVLKVLARRDGPDRPRPGTRSRNAGSRRAVISLPARSSSQMCTSPDHLGERFQRTGIRVASALRRVVTSETS